MQLTLPESWSFFLKDELQKPYFLNLIAFIKEQYATTDCFPAEEDVFKAFEICTFSAVKVVIIGQDPYHNFNQANGLCFSVNDGVSHPPSLINIFKEINTDLGKAYPVSGNLERWAQQGVFLLNATLTVRAHEAASHQKKGWEPFTDAVIKTISTHNKKVIFLLWGGFAKKKAKLIDASKHTILTSGHPSPLSANRGYWFGNSHFSQVNTLLEDQGKTTIDW
ncbi:uracil-DNA glycosylase [Bizionia gelidisalsuginis]|uniref:Uracil-DNA glycosylase n=2 Tax=Bizionia TaxID=283785 RepID=A0A8H2QFQ7_9FLAO|nr:MULTISPECIES: uracil-DNA glycosylase [Bizionia]TYB76629.1 uracil-DNA glycosylase [Bizionia saleffrena]TYC14178.1 uracil-DNA glycosylase [Bizionia gelidisalsuginis]